MRNGLTETWRRLRSLLGTAAATETTDAQLLGRFLAERDEAAFAELVRRHGSMVHGVCRRILANSHDAEDAFQATFLILSHKAASIRKGDCLASWLHGVALHTAISLKRNILRRKEQQLPANTPQAERDEVSWREVQQLLDEELARLPERFRQPLILCYLEGKTRDEAADELGWSPSTFRGRLERAHERLRWRLEQRGLTLSAALLATLAAKNAEAAILPTTPSAQAATLASEVMRSLLVSKVKTAALCFVALFLSVAIGSTTYRCLAVEPGALPKTAETPKPPTPSEDDQAHLDGEEPKQRDKNEILKIDTVADLDTVLVDPRKANVERRMVLDGLLPFKAWPKDLTDGQTKLRDGGLKLAKQWLEKETVEFHLTRAANCGDLVRYTSGPTKVVQKWKGQNPSELYARDAFHVNVLLIQEGYSPFVCQPKAAWDAKTLACYEAAEQYAKLHKKGIWQDALFAERLKKIAETWTEDEQAGLGPIKEWRAKGATQLPEVLTPQSEFMTFSPDGNKLLVSVRGLNDLQLLDRTTLKEAPITYPLNGQYWPLAFTNDGEAWGLFMSPREKPPTLREGMTYRFVNLRTGKQLWSVDTLQKVRQAVLSPDGKYLAIMEGGDLSHLTLWSAQTGAVVDRIAELEQQAHAVQLEIFKRQLVASKTTDTNEKSKLYVEAAKLRESAGNLQEQCENLRATSVRLRAENQCVECVAFSPDGKMLATSCREAQKQPGEISVWETDSGKTVAVCQTPGVCTKLHYSGDGKRLFALLKRPPGANPDRGDSWVIVLNPATLGQKRVQFSAEEHATATAFSVSPDGQLLAIAWERADKEKMAGKRLRIYDADTGKEMSSPEVDFVVRVLAFSPDGKFLADVDEQGRVKLWEALR